MKLTPLQELEIELRLYHDALDQCVMINLDYIEKETHFLKLEWEGLLHLWDPDETDPPSYHHFDLNHEIRCLRNIDDWTTWKP